MDYGTYTLIPNSVLKISSVDIDLCLNSLMLMVCYSLDSVQTPHNVLPQHSVCLSCRYDELQIWQSLYVVIK